mmetsp:Transcript_17986/g.28686  ORF Transcript_17986/g.28686 Transcript_17986/m.28686 type:complete len:206 (+) Transcript_17986:88-705(+)|eukprot:CAMPEP_0197021520 /NCGR_PEP_ID=MMETSP1384-20130603/2406_1 /TAXON_ID=29189 /ORGANISM="Ammonia sp." /LENGTH=205 /DNA_ID=CAMNT_0042449363 /DNA_START=81 /DNA_END=698 /DNA_ORIENTATION=+
MAMQDALIHGDITINTKALIEAINLQKEGFEDISSDSDSEIVPLDIYGRPLGDAATHKEGTIPEDQDDDVDVDLHRNNLRPASNRQSRPVFERMFSKLVLLVFCIFVPVLCVSAVLFALKQKSKCGAHCVLEWKHSGFVLLSMAILLCCDLSYIVAGVLYHAMNNNKRLCLRQRKRAKMELVAEEHDGDLGIDYDGKLDDDDEGK